MKKEVHIVGYSKVCAPLCHLLLGLSSEALLTTQYILNLEPFSSVSITLLSFGHDPCLVKIFWEYEIQVYNRLMFEIERNACSFM